MRKGCRAAHPDFTDRLLTWLGRPLDLHDWKPYKKQRKDIIFTCRRCECRLDQVQQTHTLEWRSIHEDWTYDWEKEWFDEAVEQQ